MNTNNIKNKETCLRSKGNGKIPKTHQEKCVTNAGGQNGQNQQWLPLPYHLRKICYECCGNEANAHGRNLIKHQNRAVVFLNFRFHNLHNFVKKYYSPEALQQQTEKEAKIAALVAVKQYLEDQKQLRVPTN